MTRAGAGNVVVLPPSNNVYTGLALSAVIVQVLGLIVLFVAASDVGGLF
jgi:hypothetical protein